MAAVKIMVKGPGDKRWTQWAILRDAGYEGEAQESARKWVRHLRGEVEYQILPA